MEKQYYTPKIEHFHVGFRYERRNHDSTWRKTEFNTNDNLSYFETCLNDGTFQVKPLDHDDIKEAGWEKKGRFYSLEVIEFEQGVSPLDCFGISKGDLCNYIAKVGSKYLIFNEANDVLFKGKIPNFNKLLDVMDMLEIRNNK